MGSIDADEPVGFAACLGTAVEVVIFSAVFQVVHALTDRLVGKAADPKTGEGLGTTEVMVDVAEDQLAFAPGIGGYDDALGLVKQ